MAATLANLIDDALALIFDADSSDEGSIVEEDEYDKYLKPDDSARKKNVQINSEENNAHHMLPFKPPQPTNPEEIPASITVKSLVPIEMKKRFMAEDYQYVRDNLSHLLDNQETEARPKPKGDKRDAKAYTNAERDEDPMYRSARVEDEERNPSSSNRGAISYSPERGHDQREVYEHSHKTRKRGGSSNCCTSYPRSSRSNVLFSSKDDYYGRTLPKSRGHTSDYAYSDESIDSRYHPSRLLVRDDWSRRSAAKKSKKWLGLR